MKPTPPNWPRISSALFYEDPAAAITWLERAFGFKTRIRVDGPDGSIVHSELEYGEGLIMVGGVDRPGKPDGRRVSPRAIGGRNTQSVMVYVDDVEAHCAHARAAGAAILQEPETHDHGEGYWIDRTYEVADCEGHRWWFVERLHTYG